MWRHDGDGGRFTWSSHVRLATVFEVRKVFMQSHRLIPVDVLWSWISCAAGSLCHRPHRACMARRPVRDAAPWQWRRLQTRDCVDDQCALSLLLLLLLLLMLIRSSFKLSAVGVFLRCPVLSCCCLLPAVCYRSAA